MAGRVQELARLGLPAAALGDVDEAVAQVQGSLAVLTMRRAERDQRVQHRALASAGLKQLDDALQAHEALPFDPARRFDWQTRAQVVRAWRALVALVAGFQLERRGAARPPALGAARHAPPATKPNGHHRAPAAVAPDPFPMEEPPGALDF